MSPTLKPFRDVLSVYVGPIPLPVVPILPSPFDASVAAKYIRIPVCCTPALFDPCVAPVGQFSVCNSIKDEYKTVYIREVGHYPATEKDLELEKKVEEWCGKMFAAK